MLTWKVILEVLCIIILAVLIFLFVVPYLMEATSQVNPIIFEMGEEIKCHLFQRLGICLSLYPNPVKEGKKVEVTFRARRWYDRKVCLASDSDKRAVLSDNKPACCFLSKGKCKTEFTAVSDMTGYYFAFIDANDDKKWNEEEVKGETKELIVEKS